MRSSLGNAESISWNTLLIDQEFCEIPSNTSESQRSSLWTFLFDKLIPTRCLGTIYIPFLKNRERDVVCILIVLLYLCISLRFLPLKLITWARKNHKSFIFVCVIQLLYAMHLFRSACFGMDVIGKRGAIRKRNSYLSTTLYSPEAQLFP